MPISDCEVRDPRIRRTRQLLQQALGQLLQSRSFEEITVQDIAEAATVNRATFYDHYTDKFALLEALIAGFPQPAPGALGRLQRELPRPSGRHHPGHM
jgi:AcrR family transcriptional regulator